MYLFIFLFERDKYHIHNNDIYNVSLFTTLVPSGAFIEIHTTQQENTIQNTNNVIKP